ncbi:MAG: 7-cyano-7-deazaguanine synthase [Tepidisphaerales bacterium]
MAKSLAIVLCDGGMKSAVAACLAAQRHRIVTVTLDGSTGLDPSAWSDPAGGGVAAGAVSGGPPAATARATAGGVGSRRRAAVELLSAHLKPHREHILPMASLNVLRRSVTSAAGDWGGAAGVEGRSPAALAGKLTELLPAVAIAARFAAHHGAVAIYAGLRVGTEAQVLARATEYQQIWNELLQYPCGLTGSGDAPAGAAAPPPVELVLPLLELELWQVVDLGVQVGCPFERTWSCWQDTAEPCGACPGCRRREAAFDQAARADPLRKRVG